jgi:hypothetical protein
VLDWLAVVKAKEWDFQASLDEVRRRSRPTEAPLRKSPKWAVKNVDVPNEVVEVTGPTVGNAIEQILAKRSRPGSGEIVLRVVGGARLRDPSIELPPDATLEFINSFDAKLRAAREILAIGPDIPDLEDWLALVKTKEWDVQASLDEIRRGNP